jgi:hypothetical protein
LRKGGVEGRAGDALLLAGDDILRGIELGLQVVSYFQSMTGQGKY